MWDPRTRPTATEALRHEYFSDAVDPLRPRSARSGLLKKHMSVDVKALRDSTETPTLSTSRSSWFRKSIIREHSPVVSAQSKQSDDATSPRPSIVHPKAASVDAYQEPAPTSKYRPFASKRATWTQGAPPSNAAPMPILPSIRPISPFSNTVNASAHNTPANHPPPPQPAPEPKPSKKLGRQLSVQSNGNHYADLHRQEPDRASNGHRGIASPNGEQKESFFSHLRKRARRLSGKPQGNTTPAPDDVEASAGIGQRHSNRNSLIVDANVNNMDTIIEKSFENVDKALKSINEQVLPLTPATEVPSSHKQMTDHQLLGRIPERHPSLSKSISTPSLDSSSMNRNNSVSGRNRRTIHPRADRKYDTPDEEDELLQEALTSANTAVRRMDRRSQHDLLRLSKKENTPPVPTQQPTPTAEEMPYNPYPTPSPSAKRNGMLFDQTMMVEPVTLNMPKAHAKEQVKHRWPTPPYEENEWAASAAASIFAAGSIHR